MDAGSATFDCAIIGGGISGLQGAIQLGRYGHRVGVIDGGTGRSTLCQCYHNVLGWPDGISGPSLRQRGKEHALRLGVEFIDDWIRAVEPAAEGFTLTGQSGHTYQTRRLLLATGIVDTIPEIDGIVPRLGLTVYVCPDCDGYEVKDRETIVMGAGKAGVNMATTLTYWTRRITYIHDDTEPFDDEHKAQLDKLSIPYVEARITRVISDDPSKFEGVELADGRVIRGERAFIAYGGNWVNSDIVNSLGVKLHHNHHVLVDPRTKATSVKYLWAAGDVVAHSEQVTIAMGDGSQAAIWIHKSLMSPSTFPEKWPDPSTATAQS
ncbi:NAD(P)/FAD-dependent oxidoreductase [Alicyclobacillus acidiphilus]|uniref:NAD(P)/FAD-dependent oxidoreductase n=1 Tax=Alicyclobacillus acidiphilus TaxID=182455 RepID=UPI00082CA07D|nr:NAD(P)/FAD-dependent oxidoreductase [Alicyclobacillus acidiphilus]